MVRPALRSHSRARLKRRLPGNGHTIHYVRRRPSEATCPITGQPLHGVPRLRPAILHKLAKTERRPSRAFGGKVSHIALQKAIIEKLLEESTASDEE